MIPIPANVGSLQVYIYREDSTSISLIAMSILDVPLLPYRSAPLLVFMFHVSVPIGPLLRVDTLCWSHHKVYQSLWKQPGMIQDAQCITTGTHCLLFPTPEYVHARKPSEPKLMYPLLLSLTSYNQPSNHAPPCLVSGYHDTSMWVTAEMGPRY